MSMIRNGPHPSNRTTQPFTPKVWIGVVGALITVAVWCSWLIATRFSVTTSLGQLELALLRFGVPALVFSPVLVRRGFWPSDQKPLALLTILFGAGMGFFLLASTGFKFAPVRDSAAMMAPMLPLYTAILSLLLFKTKFTRVQGAGFCAIAAGVFLLVLLTVMESGVGWTSVGHALLFAAAFVWALYTLAFRSTGLDPLYTAAFLVFWSALIAGVLALIFGVDFSAATLPELGFAIVFQGIVSGIIGFLSFGMAVRHLGPPRATAITALVPVVATLAGALFLNEVPLPAEWIGIVLVALGVLAASGAVGAGRAGSKRA